jgi:hypothetical protein
MSNLTDLLKDITGLSEEAINKTARVIGDMMGVISDVGAVLSFAQQLLDFGQPDLSSIQAEIEKGFKQLGKENQAAQILQRNTTLNGYISSAYTQLQNLQAELNSHPIASDIIEYIKPCEDALNELGGLNQPDIVWNLTAGWPIYWDDTGEFYTTCYYPTPSPTAYAVPKDVGFGQLPPPLNPDGLTVFYYVYSLPLYLFAVSILLAVGGALDPNFAANYSAPVTAATSLLQQKYQTILTGFMLLLPPDYRNSSLSQLACYRGAVQGLRVTYDSKFVPVSANMEYGVVEKFSGYSSMGSSYSISLRPDGTADPRTYNKLRLRLEKRRRDTYVGVGLSQVWQVINTLNSLVGAPQSPDPNVFWSCRWLLAWIPGPSPHTLRNFAALVITTEPFDTQYAPNNYQGVTLSIRGLLTNFAG